MKIKTNQGKEFELSDVLLYSVNKNKIITIVNDEEQMKKFSITGSANDAPISIIDYSDATLNEIITSMKQIKSYQVSDSKDIDVKYIDGTSIMFDESNMEIINSNLQAQRKANEENALRAWYDLPDKEKELKKKQTKKNFLKGLSVTLAATVLAGGLYIAGKNMKKTKPEETVGEIVSEEMYNPTDPRKTIIVEEPRSDYTTEAAALYKETEEINPFIIRYQQVVNINWNQELALEVVEFINGQYPTSMLAMNEENAEEERTKIMQAIDLLIAGNLNPEVTANEMINLEKYIVNEQGKVLVHNAMTIARACINESIGEPNNGEIIEYKDWIEIPKPYIDSNGKLNFSEIVDESNWTNVNKFSKSYTDSIDQLLNYEYDTLNDPSFLSASSNVRIVVSSIFQSINATLPTKPYYITINAPGKEETILYYRYFYDEVNDVAYYPEEGKNATIQYREYFKDENKETKSGKVYSENEMFVMAGSPLELNDSKTYASEANSNIKQYGIQTKLDSVYNTAIDDFKLSREQNIKSR